MPIDNMDKIQQPSKEYLPKKDNSFFNSAIFAQTIEDTFNFCQDESNLKMVFIDLPHGIDNYLDLKLVNATKIDSDHYEITWNNNPNAKVQGSLAFHLKKAAANRGTQVIAEAVFDKLHFHNEDPSSLINVFLKRLKTLCETGELPTIKGQPNGREDNSNSKKQNLH